MIYCVARKKHILYYVLLFILLCCKSQQYFLEGRVEIVHVLNCVCRSYHCANCANNLILFIIVSFAVGTALFVSHGKGLCMKNGTENCALKVMLRPVATIDSKHH